MTPEDKYYQLYHRLWEEVAALHKSNQQRIRVGMRALLIVTFGLMLLMFLVDGNRVFTLMLWIFSMFALVAYLIAVEYADDELKKKLQEITEMEQALDLEPLTPLPPKRPGRLAQRLRKVAEEKANPPESEEETELEDASAEESEPDEPAPEHTREEVQP